MGGRKMQAFLANSLTGKCIFSGAEIKRVSVFASKKIASEKGLLIGAASAWELPLHHRDLFDRILIAQ
jgi:PIN domain nuclease of toxin-antitoxin system